MKVMYQKHKTRNADVLKKEANDLHVWEHKASSIYLVDAVLLVDK